jgi:hypothetical protein
MFTNVFQTGTGGDHAVQQLKLNEAFILSGATSSSSSCNVNGCVI